MTISTQSVQNVVIVITVVGGALLYFRNRIPQQNVAQLTALTGTYEKRIAALEQELKSNHKIQLDNVAAISDLQGQIKVYKDLPLRELADGIKKVVDTNQDILNTLKSSALTLVTDTKDAAAAAQEVKTDLAVSNK